MDTTLCQRLQKLQSEAGRVSRLLNAFNGFTRITPTEIAARRISLVGMKRLLPQQVIPITFLGITVGHETVIIGSQWDAQQALKAKLVEIDESVALREIITFCDHLLAQEHVVSATIIDELERTCQNIEKKINEVSSRQRELIESTCHPFPHINRNKRR